MAVTRCCITTLFPGGRLVRAAGWLRLMFNLSRTFFLLPVMSPPPKLLMHRPV